MFKPLMWTFPNMGALHSHDHQHHGHGEHGGPEQGLLIQLQFSIVIDYRLNCIGYSVKIILYQIMFIFWGLSLSAGRQFITWDKSCKTVRTINIYWYLFISLSKYWISVPTSWQFILFLSRRTLLIIWNPHSWLNLGKWYFFPKEKAWLVKILK